MEANNTPLNEIHALKAKLEETLRQLQQASAGTSAPASQPVVPLEALPPEEALAALQADPVGFVQQVVAAAADKHLVQLKEEAEFQGALNAFLRSNPDAERFLPFIIDEVRTLILNDKDGAIDPWNTLLDKGHQQFREKFKETLKKNPELLTLPPVPAGVHVEGGASRVQPEPVPSFTREQIARMSMDKFLQHEAAINEALRNKRIR